MKAQTTNRRYDIDWLRVIAIGLLLIYHIAIIFQPWGVFIGFIQRSKSIESLWIPMSMLNIWRIPLLFFISGMGVCFAMKKRTWKQLLLERTKRIFVPFVFGILFIVPVHILLWQRYYNQDVSYSVSPGHLWFLGNIFIYVIVLSPVLYYLQQNNNIVIGFFKKLYIKPIGFLIVAIPFILETFVINPEPYELYAMTLHGFIIGMLAFFFGFTFVASGNVFWQTVLKWRWLYLSISGTVFIIRMMFFELKAPGYLMAFESVVWIFAILGFSFKHLNRKNKILSYISKGAYPIYILHMVFLYLGSVIILPLEIPAFIKFILIVIFTFSGCLMVYDLIIRRINFIKPLFGLNK